jgi:YidC/Oxa1 family membrane protein insertase
MDKNSIIGLVVIGVLLVGYMLITSPNKEDRAEMKRKQDSIAMVEHRKDSLEKKQKEIVAAQQDSVAKTQNDSLAIIADTISAVQKDSIRNIELQSKYGIFSESAKGDEKFTVIENNKMIITLTNHGGKIYSVELKDYKTYYQEPLILFVNDDQSVFGMELIAEGKPVITNEMYFRSTVSVDTVVAKNKEVKVAMRLEASKDKYIEYVYTVQPDNFMIDFDINIVGLQREIENNPYITVRWQTKVPGLERGRDWESDNTTIFLKMSDDEIESLGETKEKDEFKTNGSAKWIAYKQQFFSSILIADEKLDNPTVSLTEIDDPNSKFLKYFNSEFTIQVKNEEKQSANFKFYFGPNKYSTLKKYDLNLEKVVPLGWGIFGWVNKFGVIPIFNWLGGFINSYGLIILLLTLIIKIILFPLTYKSYKSSAKMRVLKPQVDALNEKFPKGKEMEKQQAVMALYKKAGASPMGGCLPMLLQFPILIAMFRFFPASIELRQESFLWANDLSSYDAIVEWSTHIPLLSDIYGNHISLFTLLMAISMLISTWMTSANQPQTTVRCQE